MHTINNTKITMYKMTSIFMTLKSISNNNMILFDTQTVHLTSLM